MNTAHLAEREREEAADAREVEALEHASTPTETVLGLQRSAGNAAVSRRLGVTPDVLPLIKPVPLGGYRPRRQ
jgi:hypothetical protein